MQTQGEHVDPIQKWIWNVKSIDAVEWVKVESVIWQEVEIK